MPPMPRLRLRPPLSRSFVRSCVQAFACAGVETSSGLAGGGGSGSQSTQCGASTAAAAAGIAGMSEMQAAGHRPAAANSRDVSLAFQLNLLLDLLLHIPHLFHQLLSNMKRKRETFTFTVSMSASGTKLAVEALCPRTEWNDDCGPVGGPPPFRGIGASCHFAPPSP